jgi:hypothetical protein
MRIDFSFSKIMSGRVSLHLSPMAKLLLVQGKKKVVSSCYNQTAAVAQVLPVT